MPLGHAAGAEGRGAWAVSCTLGAAGQEWAGLHGACCTQLLSSAAVKAGAMCWHKFACSWCCCRSCWPCCCRGCWCWPGFAFGTPAQHGVERWQGKGWLAHNVHLMVVHATSCLLLAMLAVCALLCAATCRRAWSPCFHAVRAEARAVAQEACSAHACWCV